MPKRPSVRNRKNHIIEIEQLRPTWAEVDIDALAFNIGLIRKRVGTSRIFPVVKADAYGHGALPICRALGRRNLDCICLALLEEGIELRNAGIELPVLILGPLEIYQIGEAVRHRFIPSAYRMDIIDEIEKVARSIGRKVPFHLKLDTGMGRLGLFQEQAEAVAAKIRNLKYGYAEGIFSNFSSADEPHKPATREQMKSFFRFIAVLEAHGIRIPTRHLANSSGILNFPESHLDAVRPGLLIYGLNPPSSPLRLPVEPVLALKSRIVSLKEYRKNVPIGYGGRFVTKRKSRIAVLPVGYDDGIMRALSPEGEVILKGKRAPIVGAVSMDLITIDVTDIRGVKTGDVATLIGRERAEEISALELARKAGTIPYEILCRIGRRVPRIYVRNGAIRSIEAFHAGNPPSGPGS